MEQLQSSLPESRAGQGWTLPPVVQSGHRQACQLLDRSRFPLGPYTFINISKIFLGIIIVDTSRTTRRGTSKSAKNKKQILNLSVSSPVQWFKSYQIYEYRVMPSLRQKQRCFKRAVLVQHQRMFRFRTYFWSQCSVFDKSYIPSQDFTRKQRRGDHDQA